MHKYLYAILIGISVFSLISCDGEVGLERPAQGELDSLSLTYSEHPDSENPDISQPAAKGLQWKAWEQWFKNCPQNNTFRDDIIYLGASSSKGLGYILSKDKSLNKWDFLKISKDTTLHKTFFDRGVDVPQCDLSQMKDFSFDMVADGNFLKSVNGELAAFIANARSISIKAGTWRIESMDTGPFLAFINSSNDPVIMQYKEALLNKKNVVLTKVLKVTGFEAEIESKDTMNIGLKAKLENGLNVNVIPVDTSRKIGFGLNFKRAANNKLVVSSTGEFSLFAQASKGRKLK